MRCSKAKEYLSRDLDAQLPPDATVALRSHLDACAECREHHEDLLLARRMLAATEPELPENFEWKLQLRLNQALRDRAAETAYPWDEPATDRWRLLRNFTTAAAVGMAAVLALAVFFGPVDLTSPRPEGTLPAATSLAAGRTDRLPLQLNSRSTAFGGPTLQSVSSSGQRFNTGGTLERGWSGDRLEDLQTIQRLRANNLHLTRTLMLYQREIQRLQAQLDTTGAGALNLEQEAR
jgi:hypothetical protein